MKLQKQRDTRPFSLPTKILVLLLSIACYIGGFLLGLIVADASISTLTSTQGKLAVCNQRLLECNATNSTPLYERRIP